jgi:glycosyltransferase involved in cell wall biosynthesis
VAVVVPAHDEAELLPRCLDHLAAAVARCARRGVAASVVVVLDACRDGSAAACVGRPGVRVVPAEVRSVGAARALGCALALTGEPDPAAVWLATTDADSAVPPGWLLHHLDLAAGGYDLVLGTVRVTGWEVWPEALRAAYRAAYRPVEGHPHVHGTNLGIRGDAYLRVGGFRALTHDEDVDLAIRMRVTGAAVAATARQPVATSARPSGRAPLGFSGYLRDLAGGVVTS